MEEALKWSEVPSADSSQNPMLRGGVRGGDFDPSLGGEIQKTRPAVIVGNNASNRNLKCVQVVPILSHVAGILPVRSPVDQQPCRRSTNEPSAFSVVSPNREPLLQAITAMLTLRRFLY
jgi:hypothetical protein